MKIALFDLKDINTFFNAAHDNLDDIMNSWDNVYGNPAIYSSDMMREITKKIILDYMNNFEELFIENDIYFTEA
tara:strand:- start:4195 stop:4416 length:222 start_codon:yes stop_codon:yes gene_type:complete